MGQITTRPQAAIQAASAKKSFSEFISAEPIQRSIRNTLRDRAGEFTTSLIELCTGDSNLQKCDQGLLLKEALRAGALGLPLTKSLGFSYLVVYKNSVKVTTPEGREVWTKVPTPTFILGYKGYIQLAQRSGVYRTINADVVYEGELRSFDKLSGTITFDGEKKSDRIIGYFAYFELLNGFRKTLYMTVEQMAEHAKRHSKGLGKDVTIDNLLDAAQSEPEGKTVGWIGDFTSMAKKTVLRLLIGKYGPLSVSMQKALEADTDEIPAESDMDECIPEAEEVIQVSDSTDDIVDTDTGEIISKNGSIKENNTVTVDKDNEAPSF